MKRDSIRIAVVQLARLGDSIQSLMALRAAQQAYPELEITYIAHESFAGAAERCPWIHQVFALPTEKLVRPMLDGTRNAAGMLPELAAWLEPIARSTYDVVLNWTYSETSSFLAGVLPARVRLGYSRRRDGTLSVIDGWSHYIHSVVQTDTVQSIHLTDILTTQLLTALQVHFDEPAEDSENQSVTSKSFFEIRRSPFVCDGWNHPGIRWLAIQLGASSFDKTWSPESWAKFASLVLRRHDDTRIILVGDKHEKGIEKKFFEALRNEERAIGSRSAVFEKRIHSKVGTTGFDQWAQILADAQWVVSADTAALHLASVLGTRVLNVSVGPVRFRETGPYGNGHYVVRPNKPGAESAVNDIPAEAVYAAWTYASTEWQHRRDLSLAEHFANLGSNQFLSQVEVYRSKIRATDDGGGIHYETLVNQRISLENWYGQVLGHLAREWYCGWVPPVGQELERAEISPELVQNLRKLAEGISVLDRIYGETIRASEELYRKSKSLKSETLMRVSDRETIHELGKKIEELEALSARVGTAQEPLQTIHRLARILMHNLSGKLVSEVANETVGVYRFLRIGVQGLQKWTDHTLGLARPIAVANRSTVVSIADGRVQRSPSA